MPMTEDRAFPDNREADCTFVGTTTITAATSQEQGLWRAARRRVRANGDAAEAEPPDVLLQR